MMLRELGDTAWLVEVASTSGDEALARVQRAAELIRRAAWPEVREIVPAFTTLAVHLNPEARMEEVGDRLRKLLRKDATQVAARSQFGARRSVEIPVCYDAEFGVDLSEVAAATGLSVSDVVARHAGAVYRVQAVGFSPGFPYLLGMPAELNCPRRAAPRAGVPAGSVGIGGAQTGVYPQATPGGWQLIGRTPIRLFDPGMTEPSLLKPGDNVRFRPVDRTEFERMKEAPIVRLPADDRGRAPIEVLKPGTQTLVQDLGRFGWQDVGVTTGGAMDREALKVANIVVGNAPTAAGLEWVVRGPTLVFRERCWAVIGGAEVDGWPSGRPLKFEAGEVIDLSRIKAGNRGVLAVRGGIDVPEVMGSRSTHLAAGFGGVNGRALRAGDRLRVGPSRMISTSGGWSVSANFRRSATDEVTVVRVMRGPEANLFGDETWTQFLGTRYQITAQSDRMGLRLNGPEIQPQRRIEMVSQPVVEGTIQVPPNGLPIVLMADRQSLGGYPRIATVISVDLGRLAQVRPGLAVQFEECDLAEAEALRLAAGRDLRLLAVGVREKLIFG